MPRRAKKPQGKFLDQMRHVRDHWTKADPTTFGLNKAQIQQFGREYERALAAHARVEELRTQLARAMSEKRTAIGSLRRTFGGLSTIIDGLARVSGDPRLYIRAGIKRPDRRGPLPMPAVPKELKIKPRTNGELELRFKIIDQGRGNLMYEVRRLCQPMEGGERPWEPVAITPKRMVIDDNVPPGLRSIRYQVRARRTNGKTGEWSSPVGFPFGTIPSGQGSAVPPASAEPKAAGQVEGKPAGAAIAGKPGRANRLKKLSE